MLQAAVSRNAPLSSRAVLEDGPVRRERYQRELTFTPADELNNDDDDNEHRNSDNQRLSARRPATGKYSVNLIQTIINMFISWQ